MKKTLFSFVLVGLMGLNLSALTLDTNSAKADFIAYKFANTGVPGTFKDTQFTFPKTEGSVVDILQGASAKVDFNKIDTKLPIRNHNITTKLVKFMKTPIIDVKFVSVKGDDKVGDIVAQINMNDVKKDVKMQYTIKDGMLKAMGQIKQTDFMPEAFDKFKNDKVIQSLHGKRTHDEVTVVFEANIK